MKASAVTDRQLEGAIVSYQNENIAGRIQNCSTVAAVCQMLFDSLAKFWRNGVIDVIRNLRPYMLAVQNHDPPPFLNSPNRLLCLEASWGASTFCIMSLARSRRVFTTPSLTPKADAVSAMLSSCTSRRISTSRYSSGRLAIAFR